MLHSSRIVAFSHKLRRVRRCLHLRLLVMSAGRGCHGSRLRLLQLLVVD